MARIKSTTKSAKKSTRGNVALTTVIRRSVSLERDVDSLAHELVGDANFSAFVNEAMREKAQRVQMLHLLDDLDAEFGEIDEKTKEKADALWQTASRSTRAR
jgi:hypothetical protein